jgi:hypothetical protein
MPHVYPVKRRGTCGNSLTVTHTLHWLSKGPEFAWVSVEIRVHVKKVWAVGMSAPLAHHTHPHPAKAGSCVHGHCALSGGTRGGTGLAFLLKVLRYAKSSVPSPEMGFPKLGTYDSMGATGQVSPSGQTPDGGYSVREPAARAWGARLGLANRSASQKRA